MPLPPAFVQTDQTRFVLGGADFPVAGVNCYFLSYCSAAARAHALASIKTTGANVIRTWAFLNARQSPPAGAHFQYFENGQILINEGEDGLQRLDALIETAEQEEFRLILPLVNYWDDLGGMPTYLRWLLPNESLAPEEFYRRPEARAAFKNWIAHLLNRTNSRTGVLYRDSPAIFAWELANEPRCPGDRELLLDWTRDMAQFVKSQDPNHLVALGDEGFLRRTAHPSHLYRGGYGVDFEATLGIPEIDFGTFHFYPFSEQMNTALEFGDQWIRDHIASGRRANKPVLLEEFGIRIDDPRIDSGEHRDEWYGRWLRVLFDAGGAGALLWMIGSQEPTVAGNRDEYTVYRSEEIPSLQRHIADVRLRRLDIS